MKKKYQNDKYLKYLEEKYDSNNKPVKIKDKKIIDMIIKYESKFYDDNLLNFSKFNKYLDNNKLLKKFINSYDNIKDRDSKIDKKMITNKLKKDIYDFINGKTYIFHKYKKTNLYKKQKKQNPKEPSDYRYLTDHNNFIKIIDRIFIDINKKLVNKKFIDINIFIVKILDIEIENFSYFADKNTKSKDRVICLDFSSAFDNVEWYKLYDHMINFYKKSMSSELAETLTDFYFFILQNRIFNYEKNKIKIKKGISQGFPSSNLIFTIFMIEIIEEWKHKINLDIYNYLDINIYVDDVYIKFKRYDEMNNYLVYKLIKEFEANNIIINNEKCFCDQKLNLYFEYRQIENNDFYLGIPFTRKNKEYFKYIMKNFNDKKYKEIKEYNIICSWKYFKNYLSGYCIKIKRIITGFLLYKLKPLINNKITNLYI